MEFVEQASSYPTWYWAVVAVGLPVIIAILVALSYILVRTNAGTPRMRFITLALVLTVLVGIIVYVTNKIFGI